MRHRGTSIGLATLIVALLSGCVTVSLHELRATDIVVADPKTKRPVPNLPITVEYLYDSYGVFYVVRIPERVEASTDENGRARIDLATWSQRIWLDIGKSSALTIYADTVRNGGELTSSPRGVAGESYSVTFLPL